MKKVIVLALVLLMIFNVSCNKFEKLKDNLNKNVKEPLLKEAKTDNEFVTIFLDDYYTLNEEDYNKFFHSDGSINEENYDEEYRSIFSAKEFGKINSNNTLTEPLRLAHEKKVETKVKNISMDKDGSMFNYTVELLVTDSSGGEKEYVAEGTIGVEGGNQSFVIYRFMPSSDFSREF